MVQQDRDEVIRFVSSTGQVCDQKKMLRWLYKQF